MLVRPITREHLSIDVVDANTTNSGHRNLATKHKCVHGSIAVMMSQEGNASPSMHALVLGCSASITFQELQRLHLIGTSWVWFPRRAMVPSVPSFAQRRCVVVSSGLCIVT